MIGDSGLGVGSYVDVEGTQTYFERFGEGPPIVCLHSAGGDSRIFHRIAPELVDRGFAVFALDLPGHGKSYPVDWKPLSTTYDFGTFVAAFLRAVGLERPAILGCSIGADIAVDLAVNHSSDVCACIALEGAGRTPSYGNTLVFADPHANGGWEAVVEMGGPSTFCLASEPSVLHEIEWILKGSVNEVRAHDLAAWSTHDVHAGLQRLEIPVLVCRGSNDFHLTDQMMMDSAAASERVLAVQLEGLGHFPMLEAPAAIAQLVADFVNGDRTAIQSRHKAYR